MRALGCSSAAPRRALDHPTHSRSHGQHAQPLHSGCFGNHQDAGLLGRARISPPTSRRSSSFFTTEHYLRCGCRWAIRLLMGGCFLRENSGTHPQTPLRRSRKIIETPHHHARRKPNAMHLRTHVRKLPQRTQSRSTAWIAQMNLAFMGHGRSRFYRHSEAKQIRLPNATSTSETGRLPFRQEGLRPRLAVENTRKHQFQAPFEFGRIACSSSLNDQHLPLRLRTTHQLRLQATYGDAIDLATE